MTTIDEMAKVDKVKCIEGKGKEENPVEVIIITYLTTENQFYNKVLCPLIGNNGECRGQYSDIKDRPCGYLISNQMKKPELDTSSTKKL